MELNRSLESKDVEISHLQIAISELTASIKEYRSRCDEL